MFSKNQAPQRQASASSMGGSTFSVFGPDTRIKGDVSASADLHIDGRIEGDVTCTSLVQGEASEITGAVKAAGGVAPQVFVDVLAKGGGGGVALERLRPYLLQHDASSLRFFMSNALKDLGYYTTMAQDGAAARGIAQAVRDTFAHAVTEGGPEKLVPELVDILVKNPL